MTTYSSLPNKLASAVNGIEYAYRDAGEGPVPLVLLQHFRGNLDNWDPALIDALASTRTARHAGKRHRERQAGIPARPRPAPRYGTLTVSSHMKTDSGRPDRIGMLAPDDASSLPRAQKERRGTRCPGRSLLRACDGVHPPFPGYALQFLDALIVEDDSGTGDQVFYRL